MLTRKFLSGLLCSVSISVFLSVPAAAAPIYVNEEFGYHGYETHLKEDVPIVGLNDIMLVLENQRQAVIPSLNDIMERQITEKTEDSEVQLPIPESNVQSNDVYSDYKAGQGSETGEAKIPLGAKDTATEKEVNTMFRTEAAAAIKSGKLKLKDVSIGKSATFTNDCTKQYMNIIAEHVDRMNKKGDVKISVAMVQTIIAIESGGKTDVVGTGAWGLMQIQKNVHADAFVKYCQTEFADKKTTFTVNDLWDPYYNIAYGIQVLYNAVSYCQKYGYCRYTSSICAYNFGHGGLNSVMKKSTMTDEWDWLLYRGTVAGTEVHLDKFINHFPG